ncbi:MAG: alpha/beta fold hydrolase [Alphaproteobacteria bacterium]|nr:alpha/beta fold hydrolase [Alphaproteobacteria bacterium]
MSVVPDDEKPDKDMLVRSLYAATLAPENYDTLMDTIELFVGAGKTDPTDLALENHFQTALNILNRMGRRRREQKREDAVVQNAPGPTYVVNPCGRISAMNAPAKASSPCIPSKLHDLNIESDVLARLFTWMENGIENSADLFIEPAMIGKPAQSSCLIARRLAPLKTTVEESDVRLAPHFFVTTVELRLDTQRAQQFLSAYDMTDAEMDVAIDLANGVSPADIALKRETSINTVRAQIKAVLRKTNTTGVSDLVRLICGFSAGFAAAINASQAPVSTGVTSDLKRRRMMTLSDGRQLFWLEQGDLTGVPVICIHNMLYGVEWPDDAVEAAARKNLRIISPSRPGFGASELAPAAYGEDLLDTVANDIRQLMDHLGLGRAVIMGHVMGSVYAMRFALLYPSRVTALLGVSHAPVWREEWLDELPKRQRLIARITRHAPQLLPYVTRAGVALLDAGYLEQFVNALHKDIPADARALKRKPVFEAVAKGLEHTTQQGSEGFRRDCLFTLTDYSTSARALEHTFHIIHGDGDELVPLRNVELFAEIAPATRITRVKGAGQFLLFSHWQVVLNAISDAANSANLKSLA